MATPKMVVLDLDETLVWTNEEPLEGVEADFQACGFYVYKRPFIEEFLLTLQEQGCRMMVWTASHRTYAHEIVRKLFLPLKEKGIRAPEVVWSNERCSRPGVKSGCDEECNYRGLYSDSGGFRSEKRLKKVAQVFKICLEDIIIIEDDPAKCRDNYGNAVIVPEFKGEAGDVVLRDLAVYLGWLVKQPNIRAVEKRFWQKEKKEEEKEEEPLGTYCQVV